MLLFNNEIILLNKLDRKIDLSLIDLKSEI